MKEDNNKTLSPLADLILRLVGCAEAWGLPGLTEVEIKAGLALMKPLIQDKSVEASTSDKGIEVQNG